MSTLEDICEKYYGTKNFYKILCVNKYSPLDDGNKLNSFRIVHHHLSLIQILISVKKAYRRLSLQVHPDRNDQDENHIATEKFKILSKIYQILINPDAKTLYDEKGMVDDGSGTSLNQSSNVPKANMETVKNHFVGNCIHFPSTNDILCGTNVSCKFKDRNMKKRR